MIEAEGVADGDDGFAGHDIGGVAQAHGGKVARAFDFQHGNVEIRLRALDRGGKFASVQQMHHHFVAARDNMGVGQHQTLLAVHNDAGPQADALLPSGPRPWETLKTREARAEAGTEKAFQGGNALSFDNMGAGYVDHRRGHALHSPDHRGHARAVRRGSGRACGGQQGEQAEKKQKTTDALGCQSGHDYLPQCVSAPGRLCAAHRHPHKRKRAALRTL